MDLLKCEMCNSTITNFVNHRCLYHECSYQGTGFENPDSIFGNNHQEISATISHSVEGAVFNSSAFMNPTSTFQSSTFPQSTDLERHCDVNNTANTDARYASSNAVQNENFNYFNSAQGSLIPAAQHFENSACTSSVENLKMPFFNAAYTSEINPAEVPWTNNSALMHHCPNLSFYNLLPPNCRDPSDGLTKYDLTEENFNIWRSMESGKIGMQDFKISRFQEKEYDAVANARKSNRTEKNESCASDLYGTSLDVQYHRKPHTGKSTHTAALQLESTNANTVQREKFHNKFLNIPNFSYPNFENKVLYSNPDFGQGFLDSQPGMNDIPHYSNKSQTQFNDKIRFQNIFQCQFCGKSFSYQRNLNGEKLSLNSGNVPIKCNECNEMLKSKEKIQTYPKIAEYWENSSVLKVPKKRNPLDKRFPCKFCIKRFSSQADLERHIRTHTGEKPFSCEICGKKFTLKCNLTQHNLTHTGARPYSCEICGKTFTQKGHFKKHVLTHTGKKHFSCEICGKTFLNEQNKKLHTLTHSVNKGFQCNQIF